MLTVSPEDGVSPAPSPKRRSNTLTPPEFGSSTKSESAGLDQLAVFEVENDKKVVIVKSERDLLLIAGGGEWAAYSLLDGI